MSAKLTITIPECLDKVITWPVTAYRQWKFGYPYRKIYLGEGEFTILDPQDYYRYGNLKWFVQGNGTNLYALRTIKTEPNKTKFLSLHREIMNAPPGLLVDHRNTDSLDNRRENLRLATNSQNQCNRRKTRSHTSSRYIGVSFNKHRQKWIAYIRHKGIRIWLGAFDNEIDAARAYDAAAKKYFGEFARLNFS
jgi:hypothetical protein